MNGERAGTEGSGSGGSIYGSVTPGMVRHLRETKPWVRLASIVGFVGTGLMCLAALFMMAAGSELDPALGGGIGFVVAIVYVLGAVIYFFTSLYLFRYARSIQAFISRQDNAAMEDALGHQKSFWRLIGIILVVYIGLIGLGMLFGLIGVLIGLAS